MLGVIVGTFVAAIGAFALFRRKWLWAQMGMADPPTPSEPGRWMYLFSAVGVPIVFVVGGLIFIGVGLVSL